MSLTNALDYSVQPFQGTDVLAAVLLACALLCAVIRVRDKEPGMGWFAFSLGALGLWIGANEQHLPTGPQLDPSPWWYVMCAAKGAMGPGLAAYLDLPARTKNVTLWAIVLPSIAFAAIVAWVDLTGAVVLRVWLHALTALAFLVMSGAAFVAARREQGAGHAWLGAALVAVPILAVGLAVSRADPVALRYWAVLPIVAVGLTLPSVSLLRRHRRLQVEVDRSARAAASLASRNASLEMAVAERTAGLQSRVKGLESINRSVSHDLRGPLGGIAGLATMALKSLEGGDASLARRALPEIARQADRSLELVGSLLELARVAEAPLTRQEVDPAAVAREVVAQLALGTAAPLPPITIEPMPRVWADPALLRAILSNLIGNAVKFTHGHEHAHVEVRSVAHDDDTALQVRDNGVGFDAAAAEAIFAPFRRGHGGHVEGHGVGLSIVRRAVERHGGRVWAEPSPEGGACFTFTVPAPAHAPEEASALPMA